MGTGYRARLSFALRVMCVRRLVNMAGVHASCLSDWSTGRDRACLLGMAGNLPGLTADAANQLSGEVDLFLEPGSWFFLSACLFAATLSNAR
jgi:hypothetical protein